MSDEMLEADYEEESDQFEYDTEEEYYGEAEYENPLDEVEEMEYAAEFLEVTDEQELDQFLGKLISKVSRAAGSVIRSPAGKALGGILKSAAKKALPIAGRAVGTYPRWACRRRRWRKARLGRRQGFRAGARRNERRGPGVRGGAAIRSSGGFGIAEGCTSARRCFAPGSGSLRSGGSGTATCARLALARRGQCSERRVWRSGAFGSLGPPRTQDHCARCMNKEPEREFSRRTPCMTSIQHKASLI